MRKARVQENDLASPNLGEDSGSCGGADNWGKKNGVPIIED